MQMHTTENHKPMPKTPAAAVQRVRHLLADTGVRPPGHVFVVHPVATGRHLERVVVSLPLRAKAETQEWYDKLCPILPWACRVTMVGEIGRIEITPRG